jgi:hypothetical protein
LIEEDQISELADGAFKKFPQNLRADNEMKYGLKGDLPRGAKKGGESAPATPQIQGMTRAGEGRGEERHATVSRAVIF